MLNREIVMSCWRRQKPNASKETNTAKLRSGVATVLTSVAPGKHTRQHRSRKHVFLFSDFTITRQGDIARNLSMLTISRFPV